ncbi:hypothetical protein Tco_0217417, partial [Tanacetum coccineum]
MAQLPTEGVALDEYMGSWFRGEVPEMVIDHLENVKGCPTCGWLKRLKDNQMEDGSFG